jgi:hypothetical protein
MPDPIVDTRTNQRLKLTLFAVIITLAAIVGAIMFWATRDIPLPSNAKNQSGMIRIDISDGATDPQEIEESKFSIPAEFKPQVSEGAIAFYFRFPDKTPYSGADSPLPADRIRVVLKHHARPGAARSISALRKTQSRDGLLKSVPYFVEALGKLDIYQFDYGGNGRRTIGTYFNFVAGDGNAILAEDPGGWARSYEINRTLNRHVEITYLLPKPFVRDTQHFIEDVTSVDDVVVELVKSFQPQYLPRLTLQSGF